MKFDKKQDLLDNLTEQWKELSFDRKMDTVSDGAGLTVLTFAIGNSVRCATKGNWLAAAYNLTISCCIIALFVRS